MYHELKKAYDCGADRYWLLNVGDIKPAELDIQTFFDMAWDFGKFSHDNINGYQASIVSDWCGEGYKEDIKEILNEYYRLAWIRKPEYMGWEIEWDSPDTICPTEFSFSNYGDAWKRIDDYAALSSKVDRLMNALPDSLRIPFFEMIGYPVLASEMMNRKFLFAQLNGELAVAGDKGGTNHAARLSVEAADSIDSLTRIYNALENGKWKGMMMVPPGFCAKYHERPSLRRFDGIGEGSLPIRFDWQSGGGKSCHALDLRNAKTANGARLIDGMGYDGFILRLGDPVSAADASALPVAQLVLDDVKGDTVRLQVFHLPYFPLHEGRGCRIGVSLDGSPQQIIEFLPEEWSKPWKLSVLRNSALSEITFPIEGKGKTHTLRITGIDPGMAIQRIVIDEGSFRPGYVGPDLEKN